MQQSWTRPFWVVYKKNASILWGLRCAALSILMAGLAGRKPTCWDPRGAQECQAWERPPHSLRMAQPLGITVPPAGQRWDPPCFCVCVCIPVQSLNCVGLFTTPRTVARRAPLSMGFSRQEYWSGLPFPTPGAPPFSEMKPASPALASGFLPPEPPTRLKLRTLREIAVHLSWILWVSDPRLGPDLHQDSPMDCSVMPTWTIRFGKPSLPLPVGYKLRFCAPFLPGIQLDFDFQVVY